MNDQGIVDYQQERLLTIDMMSNLVRQIDPETGETLRSLELYLADSDAQVTGMRGMDIHPLTGQPWVSVEVDGRRRSRTLAVLNLNTGALDVQFTIDHPLTPIAFDCQGNMYANVGQRGQGWNPEERENMLWLLPNNEYGNMTALFQINTTARGDTLTWDANTDTLFHGEGGRANTFLNQFDLTAEDPHISHLTPSGDPTLSDGQVMAIHMDVVTNQLLWVSGQRANGLSSLFKMTTDGVATLVAPLDHRPRALTYMHSFCNPCPEHCGEHGRCYDNVCWCTHGFSGADCQIQPLDAEELNPVLPVTEAPSSSSAYPALFWILFVACCLVGAYVWNKSRQAKKAAFQQSLNEPLSTSMAYTPPIV